jgi:hypothetical protein
VEKDGLLLAIQEKAIEEDRLTMVDSGVVADQRDEHVYVVLLRSEADSVHRRSAVAEGKAAGYWLWALVAAQ